MLGAGLWNRHAPASSWENLAAQGRAQAQGPWNPPPPGSEHSESSQIVPASGPTSHLCHSGNGLFLLPMMGHPGFSGFSEFGH